MSNISPAFAGALQMIFGNDRVTVPATVNGVTIRGDFTDAYITDLNVGTTAPAMEVLDASAALAPPGADITIGDVLYHVADAQPGGDGTTLLILSRD